MKLRKRLRKKRETVLMEGTGYKQGCAELIEETAFEKVSRPLANLQGHDEEKRTHKKYRWESRWKEKKEVSKQAKCGPGENSIKENEKYQKGKIHSQEVLPKKSSSPS